MSDTSPAVSVTPFIYMHQLLFLLKDMLASGEHWSVLGAERQRTLTLRRALSDSMAKTNMSPPDTDLLQLTANHSLS